MKLEVLLPDEHDTHVTMMQQRAKLQACSCGKAREDVYDWLCIMILRVPNDVKQPIIRAQVIVFTVYQHEHPSYLWFPAAFYVGP